MSGLSLLLLLESDPERALPEIRAQMESATGELRHRLTDLLVGALLDVPGSEKELEERARELVALDRDSTHLLLLAQALERTGRSEEAEALRKEAATAPNRHITDEIRALAAAAGLDTSWMK